MMLGGCEFTSVRRVRVKARVSRGRGVLGPQAGQEQLARHVWGQLPPCPGPPAPPTQPEPSPPEGWSRRCQDGVGTSRTPGEGLRQRASAVRMVPAPDSWPA